MPNTTLSQDLDARFSVFLNPIRDLTKNWEVDIAKYLEEYLEELTEVQITFDGGQTTMNFAEAAMLIQGSATVYSKKVEFLWQMVLQMLDLLSNRRSTQAGAQAKDAPGGKAALDVSIEFTAMGEICESKNIDMRDEDDDDDQDGFKYLPATPLHLVEKEGEKAQYRINLFMKNGETFGAKDDFRLNRSYLTPMGVLCLSVPEEILKDGGPALFVAPDVGDEEDVVPPEIDEVPEELKESPADAPDAPEEPPPEPQDPVCDDDGAADLDVDEVAAPEPMEMEEPQDEADKDAKNNNITVIDLPSARREGLRRRGGDKEKVVSLRLTDPWQPVDPHAETPAKRPVRAGRLRKPLPCACHRASARSSRSRNRKNKNNENKENAEDEKKVEKSLPAVESFTMGEYLSNADVSSKKGKTPQELVGEAETETSKRQELNKKKQVREALKDGAADLEEAVEKVEEETQHKQRLERDLDDHYDNDGVADLDFDDLEAPAMTLPEPHNMIEVEPSDGEGASKKGLNDSQTYEPGSEYEALVQRWVSDYITTAQGQVNSSELARRVNKWREMITPVLNREEERQHFDIHSYGSQVLSYFPENGRKQTVTFNAIARNHEPKEVSRLFLSCLMLANTYNVELGEEEPGDFSMDDVTLTLLSRVRHHEELEEYAAPSQASPTRRKGKNKKKTDTSDDNYDMNSFPPATPICADITQFTVGENIHVQNPKVKAKVKAKAKR